MAKVWGCADVKERHCRRREQHEQRSHGDGLEGIYEEWFGWSSRTWKRSMGKKVG